MPPLRTIDVNHSYGTSCGFIRAIPAYPDSIKGFIKRKDVPDIIRWLNSKEAVQVVYAVEAVHRLLDKFELTDKQMELINY